MSKAYRLTLSTRLKEEIRRVAAETNLTMAEATRQAIRFGLPKLRKRRSVEVDHAEAAADKWDKLGSPPTIHYDRF